MERVFDRPSPPRFWWESEKWFGVWFLLCCLALTAVMVRPVSRAGAPARPVARRVVRAPLARLRVMPQTGAVRPPDVVKLAFPEVFDRVVPRSLVWVETGIRTSRPCVESRTRSVQILAEQRRIPWSDQYSIPEWEAIITSEKQRLVLVVRVGPPGRYEHIGFERMFLAWQLATVETDARSFSTWIPPTTVNEEVLRRAADRHEDRTSWLIRPCTVRTFR